MDAKKSEATKNAEKRAADDKHGNRKMPHSAHNRNAHGAFDLAKFMENAPAAREAMASGETAVKSVRIDATSHGTVQVSVHRQHGKKNKPNTLPPALAAGLVDFLMSALQSGIVTVDEKGDSESEFGNGDDRWDIELIPAA